MHFYRTYAIAPSIAVTVKTALSIRSGKKYRLLPKLEMVGYGADEKLSFFPQNYRRT
ncbi:MAG: hypothetical protein SVX43_11875 [Cyanobacteriota bacterium]|nr:hypothetical protein [Cyanobacteriota bacterium]